MITFLAQLGHNQYDKKVFKYYLIKCIDLKDRHCIWCPLHHFLHLFHHKQFFVGNKRSGGGVDEGDDGTAIHGGEGAAGVAEPGEEDPKVSRVESMR